MSYRVVTGPAIPFVHALPSGLGFTAPQPELPPPQYSGPWWGQAITRFVEPLGGALAQRIAYGEQSPYMYGGYYGSSSYYPSYGYGSVGFGNISPTTLLLGGGALLAVLMLGKS